MSNLSSEISHSRVAEIFLIVMDLISQLEHVKTGLNSLLSSQCDHNLKDVELSAEYFSQIYTKLIHAESIIYEVRPKIEISLQFSLNLVSKVKNSIKDTVKKFSFSQTFIKYILKSDSPLIIALCFKFLFKDISETWVKLNESFSRIISGIYESSGYIFPKSPKEKFTEDVRTTLITHLLTAPRPKSDDESPFDLDDYFLIDMPSFEKRQRVAQITGLTLDQINGWLYNQRSRSRRRKLREQINARPGQAVSLRAYRASSSKSPSRPSPARHLRPIISEVDSILSNASLSAISIDQLEDLSSFLLSPTTISVSLDFSQEKLALDPLFADCNLLNDLYL